MTFFLFWIAFGALSAVVAAKKNRSVLGWALIGLLFSFLGFLAALMVSEVEEEDENTQTGRSQSSTGRRLDPEEHEKKCPMCAEYIKLEARVCKHCGQEFSEEEVNDEIRNRLEEEIGDSKSDSEEGEKVQDGIYYCKRDEITVMPTRDKVTCPACGGQLSDVHHTYVEEEE